MQNITNNFKELLELAGKKKNLDKDDTWSEGAITYFKEIQNEIQESLVEYKAGKQVYLEDELGDILWDYLNLLTNLESENKINLEKVFIRANKKYQERISGLNYNSTWSEVKKKQKEELRIEQEALQEELTDIN